MKHRPQRRTRDVVVELAHFLRVERDGDDAPRGELAGELPTVGTNAGVVDGRTPPASPMARALHSRLRRKLGRGPEMELRSAQIRQQLGMAGSPRGHSIRGAPPDCHDSGGAE
jgi:hypothetical protein